MRKLLTLLAILALTAPVAFYGCGSGDTGPAGAKGPPGDPGGTGATGGTGGTGASGAARIADKHGAAALTAEELALTPPMYMVNVNITSATASASGVATVTFTVKKSTDNTSVTGITAASAGIFKLAPAGGGLAYNRWVPYIYRPGRTVNAGYRENNTSSTPRGTLVENGAGSYTYTFGTNLSTAAYLFPIDNVSLVGYDRTLTHRVSVYLGGHNGPTGEGDFDFVPNGSAVTATRNIVVTATCKKCHGPEFAGHGGDRVTVEGCVTCHSPNSAMVNAPADGGTTETIEMSVMIHKMHAGRELASAPGPDGIFFDDPLTPTDESADNGNYTVGSLTATWRSAAFPAVLANCQACHTGGAANVDNWKNVPSRAACGSCHDTIVWSTGVNHGGGSATSDALCAACHSVGTVVEGHDWTAKDIRNIPEFNITVTTSAPANGTHFVKGESPVITVVLKDAVTGLAIDHTTVVEQSAAAEGCITNADKSACTNAVVPGFRAANMYVTGPRARRIPVLTTAARAKVSSATAGPWDLSAGGASLHVVVDSGNFIVNPNYFGEDVLIPGDFTVTLPTDNAALTALFANPAAATAAEVVAWLNGPTATMTYNERSFVFSDRAIAYVGGTTADAGKVSIRTRALGSVNPSIQVPDTPATADLGGMFTDHAVKVTGGAVQLRQRTDPANNDLKFAWSASSLTYTLDPVDDLVPGTYMINVEFADRGRTSGPSYKTPSIGLATFQVKQAAEEKQIADGCTSCHWSTNAVGQGVGYVLDPIRHNKPFNAQAVDQCGGCHEYASAETVAALTWTTGGSTKPISKRVHAVHMGAALNYPTLTVDHEESVVGRNWQITYPMDIRNCESCHSAATSGTWKTKPGRIACMGCHDSDAATAHMKAQTYDPTPSAPWSGDEQESCITCH